jgi:hypothetical protein
MTHELDMFSEFTDELKSSLKKVSCGFKKYNNGSFDYCVSHLDNDWSSSHYFTNITNKNIVIVINDYLDGVAGNDSRNYDSNYDDDDYGPTDIIGVILKDICFDVKTIPDFVNSKLTWTYYTKYLILPPNIVLDTFDVYEFVIKHVLLELNERLIKSPEEVYVNAIKLYITKLNRLFSKNKNIDIKKVIRCKLEEGVICNVDLNVYTHP